MRADAEPQVRSSAWIDALERRYLRHNMAWLRMMTDEGRSFRFRDRLERKLQRLESALESASIDKLRDRTVENQKP